MHHLLPWTLPIGIWQLSTALSFSGKARKGLDKGEMSVGVWNLEVIMKPVSTFDSRKLITKDLNKIEGQVKWY